MKPDPRTCPTEAGRTRSALAFWTGETLFAIDIRFVLSIEEDSATDGVPFQGRGLLGAVEHRGEPVPVYDLAAFLGVASINSNKAELIETLTAREQDHIDWLDALERSVEEGCPFTKARDPTQCAFGRWYEAFSTRDHDLEGIVQRFDAPHRAIHALADELLAEAARGDAGQARARAELGRARLTTLRDLRGLFSRARRRIRETMRSVRLYLTRDGQRPHLALRLQEISDIIVYDEAELKPADRVAAGDLALGPLFPSFISRQDGATCLLADSERLLDALGGSKRRAETGVASAA